VFVKKRYRGRERRLHPRKEVELEIVYSSLDTFFYDYAVNISRGGMFIKTDNALHVGSKVNLRFSLPGSDRIIETSGRVKHTVSGKSRTDEPHGMGIEFEGLGDDDRKLIESLWKQSLKEDRKG
jgi:type IV pilus assembly protein PilZ